jgi:hypothetical protein
MTEVLEGRVARARRERLLAQFVDRSAEMALFAQVLDNSEMPIMVVSADAGMGKTSLMMRMVHECALRGLLKAELEWSSLDVLDYMSVMRKLRDALGVDHFGAFTDLINYYTDTNYTPRLDINVNLQGSVQVAGGAQISGSSVGDIAGVVLRDNMIVVQRPDITVPIEVRREQLTLRFLQGLAALSAERKVVLFFSVTEKMSDLTYQWLWEQLLKPVVDGVLPCVRAILLGQRPPLADQDLAAFVAHAHLKPLCVDDIDAYIAKRVAGKIEISGERRRGMAEIMADLTNGHPLEVAAAVDKYLTKNGVPL